MQRTVGMQQYRTCERVGFSDDAGRELRDDSCSSEHLKEESTFGTLRGAGACEAVNVLLDRVTARVLLVRRTGHDIRHHGT